MTTELEAIAGSKRGPSSKNWYFLTSMTFDQKTDGQ